MMRSKQQPPKGDLLQQSGGDPVQQQQLEGDSLQSEVLFSVFSLNCWGLKFISKDRRLRFEAIAEHLKSEIYQFVFLQEVWSHHDFEYLKKELAETYLYSVYYESGIIGSGLCMFSQVPIRHFFFVPFQANGYFYKIWHGDWFSGKGTAVAQVTYKGVALNLITTHTHVETEGVEYVPHRVTQAVCLVDTILLCLEGADMTLLVGDLNSDPEGPLFQFLSRIGGLEDTFVKAENHYTNSTILSKGDKGGTCGLPTNSYSTRRWLKKFPQGWRLDYILYRIPASDNYNSQKIRVLEYRRPLPHRIPDHFKKKISYSDHEAIAVKFLYLMESECTMQQPSPHFLQSSNSIDGPTTSFLDTIPSIRTVSSSDNTKVQLTRAHSLTLRDTQVVAQSVCLEEAIQQLEKSIKHLRYRLKCYGLFFCTAIIILFATVHTPYLPPWSIILTNLGRILLTILIVVIGCVQSVHTKQEINTLIAALKSLKFKKIAALFDAERFS